MPFYRATRSITLYNDARDVMQAGTVVEIRPDDPVPFPNLERHIREGWLVLVPELDPRGRSQARLPTDWDDIQALFQNMAEFARDNPTATFLCADDPGTNTGRIPRFGWVAYWPDQDGVEHHHSWTITMPAMRETRISLTPTQERYLQTAEGRRMMLAAMVNAARGQPALTPGEAATTPQYRAEVDYLGDRLVRVPDPYRTATEPVKPSRTVWDRLNEDE